MRSLLKVLCGLALSLGLLWANTYNPPPAIIWNKVYDSGDYDWALGVAVDDGYLYITGYSYNGTDWDFRTIKYALDGGLQWNRVYDSGDDDEACGVAVDHQGYLYVTGASHNGTDYDFRTIKYDKTIGIDESRASGFWLGLGEPSPNPFKHSTNIGYSLAQPGWVNLKVYDVSGKLVKTLSSGLEAPGHHAVTWDGRDDLGRAVAPGVYFIRMEAAGHTAARKLIRLR